MRARATTSALWAIRLLSSLAKRRDLLEEIAFQALRLAVPDAGRGSRSTRRSGSRPIRTCRKMAMTRPTPSSRKNQNRMPLKDATLRIHRRQVAGHGREEGAGIARAPPSPGQGKHRCVAARTARRCWLSGPSASPQARLTPLRLVRSRLEFGIEQRARGHRPGLAGFSARDVEIAAGIDPAETGIEDAVASRMPVSASGPAAPSSPLPDRCAGRHQMLLRRGRAEGGRQHRAARHQGQHGPDRGRGDQAGGEQVESHEAEAILASAGASRL